MKKVGIVTFHYVDNYGAVLQCYALQKAINGIDGCKAEIINYVPVGYQYPKRWETLYDKSRFEKKRESFWKFLKENCGLKSDIVHQVTADEYDVCCVGSDQIWNTRSKKREYFLPNVVEGVKKISYAASVGISTESHWFLEKWFEEYVADFEAVSLREYQQMPSVSKLINKECCCVVDPTLLLEEKDYIELIPKKEKKAPFLFFYWLKHDENLMRGVELANLVARKYGLEVVHSIFDAQLGMFVNDAGCMMYDSIEEFLWLVKNADFVVTNSYHGTIFSMHFKKPFYTYIVESMRSRIDTLAMDIDLSKNIVDKYIDVTNIEKHIVDLNTTTQFLAKKNASWEFLKRAVGIEDGKIS